MAALARDLAVNSSKSFEKLRPEIQRVLKLYDWSAKEWEAWRAHPDKLLDRKTYLTPNAWNTMPDEEITKLTGAKSRDGIKAARQKLYIKSISDRIFSNLLILILLELFIEIFKDNFTEVLISFCDFQKSS